MQGRTHGYCNPQQPSRFHVSRIIIRFAAGYLPVPRILPNALLAPDLLPSQWRVCLLLVDERRKIRCLHGQGSVRRSELCEECYEIGAESAAAARVRGSCFFTLTDLPKKQTLKP
jgi:hypothetical protein